MEHRRDSAKVYRYPLLLGLIFAAFFSFIVIKYISQARRANDGLIATHILQLSDIFKKINATAKIIGFRHENNYIDFLNVRSFQGSEIGPMTLLEPKSWQGPYLDENVSIEGKEYQIVVTKKGPFIIPGNGVKLSNGMIIGKTLIIDAKSDIEALMRDPTGLLSGDRPLAAAVEMYQNPIIELEKAEPFTEEIESVY